MGKRAVRIYRQPAPACLVSGGWGTLSAGELSARRGHFDTVTQNNNCNNFDSIISCDNNENDVVSVLYVHDVSPISMKYVPTGMLT